MSDFYQTNQFQSPPPAPKSGGGGNTLKILVAVFGGIAILIVLAVAFVGVVIARQMSDSATTKTFTSTDGLTQVDAPENWVTNLDLNDVASLELANVFSENYVVVISETDAELDNMSLDEYSSLIKTNMISAMPSLTAGPWTSGASNGMNFKQCKLKGTLEGTGISYTLACYEGARHMHQVLTWTATNRATRNGPTLDKVQKSFRETN